MKCMMVIRHSARECRMACNAASIAQGGPFSNEHTYHRKEGYEADDIIGSLSLR